MNIVNENVYLEKVIIFLEEIGINVIEKKLDNATFLPVISLGPNCIYIDLKKNYFMLVIYFMKLDI